MRAHALSSPSFTGGVHRGAEHTDLNELGRTPVAVICAGVKSILDISKTLEYLETQGVTVATVSEEHADFPAFFARSSGERSPLTLRDAEGCAALIESEPLFYGPQAANHQLELNSGMVFAVPIPQEQSFEGNEVERAIKEAVEEAERKSITGRDVTPFILKRVNELSCGRSLSANVALVLNNAKVGAAIARHLQILEDAAQGSAFAGTAI
ncbi:MAG: pseudouridine-5'-phosphate glycosidase [Olpidium bornovanus]|uniref:Pseudouridine-5'-phosphate glycosidase n=1 Tax=Olpidium bornovanus TaxID=278681 RepID=A0A8H7ZZI5_9FUNG|nr:MAG: pseudouridine-5'-phosphate glycosidase [Olpidium bornovanus]